MKNKNIWSEIQEYYNDNHSLRDVCKNFNVSMGYLTYATRKNKLKTRTTSEANKLSHKKTPRKLSENTKIKISIARKKYLELNPDKVPYLLNHYSKGESYPEKYFNEIFKNNNLIFDRYLQISYYQLDFAFIEKGINIEIDGEQHYLDVKVIESNKRKDCFLIENGWDIIRIRWSDYQRMNIEQRKKYIDELINYIDDKSNELPEIINNENHCKKCGVKIYRNSIHCVSCSSEERRKNERPSKELLILDVQSLGYSGAGRKYNVSGTTIRKWYKKMGL